LGIPCSGKSTFTKQLRVLYKCDWSDMEIQNFREIIHNNIWEGCEHLSEEKNSSVYPELPSGPELRFFCSSSTDRKLDSDTIQEMTSCCMSVAILSVT